ncbi:MAG: HD domain-containing protein [Anaerolineales bacterium]|nr:HD domain-containing protein [Anaerolineales bacterium]
MVDAVALHVIDNRLQLRNIARLGFRSGEALYDVVETGAGLAHKIAATKNALHYNPTVSNTASGTFISFLRDEGIYDYLGFPVTEGSQQLGVLELYKQTPINATQDWKLHLRFILNLAANTIQRKIHLTRQDISTAELEVAYSETLEAWVRALEIRDRCTAGHTNRVLEMTLRLASRLGVPDEMLVHISRGVLLHDIGKLAVSDTILHKTGPLNQQEWQVMREHPKFAYKLLKPIQYLRPALDIPYCHHERWDGSGYPRGLKGDGIPFQARVFSVVDVWDALTSDRPYRKAWPKEDAAAYIRQKAGEEFDPGVVEQFLEMIQMDEFSTQPIEIS